MVGVLLGPLAMRQFGVGMVLSVFATATIYVDWNVLSIYRRLDPAPGSSG